MSFVSTRLIQWGCFLAIEMAVLAFSVAVAAVPEITLLKVSDPSLNQALEKAFNLPTLSRVQSGSLEGPADTWMQKVETERLRLAGILHSSGYLDGEVQLLHGAPLPGNPDAASEKAATGIERLVFKPIPGPLYRIGSIEFVGLGEDALNSVKEQIHFQMTEAAGKIARGDALARLESEILWRLKIASYPFVRVSGREIVPDPRNELATILIKLDLGPAAKFGEITYAGLRQLHQGELARLEPFKPGDPFDPTALEKFSAALAALPSIQTARVRLADTLDDAGRAKVHVDVVERLQYPTEPGSAGPFGTILIAAALAGLAVREVTVAGGPKRSYLTIGLTVVLALILAGALALICLRLFTLAMPA